MRKITAEERIKQAVLDMDDAEREALFAWFKAVMDVMKDSKQRVLRQLQQDGILTKA
jgi:hypothetical protein